MSSICRPPCVLVCVQNIFINKSGRSLVDGLQDLNTNTYQFEDNTHHGRYNYSLFRLHDRILAMEFRNNGNVYDLLSAFLRNAAGKLFFEVI